MGLRTISQLGRYRSGVHIAPGNMHRAGREEALDNEDYTKRAARMRACGCGCEQRLLSKLDLGRSRSTRIQVCSRVYLVLLNLRKSVTRSVIDSNVGYCSVHCSTSDACTMNRLSQELSLGSRENLPNGTDPHIQRANYEPPWANTSIIGIAGASGSGKTSLSLAIIQELNLPWVVIMSMDSFYKPLTQEQSEAAFRNEFDFDAPEAIDFDVLVEKLMDIKAGYVYAE